MAYSIQTRKTNKGNWIGLVQSGSRMNSYNLFSTEPFADRGEAYKAAEAWRTANAAKNAAAKADKNKAQMTCQCCGRAHLANTGLMAHHGYQRPGNGWQTASCAGARELPFEVSRDRLGEIIVSLTAQKGRMIEHRDAIIAETTAFDAHYTSDEKNNKGRRIEKSVQITRATFETVKAEVGPLFTRYGINRDFDELKDREVSGCNFNIRNISEYITDCKTRYDGWKQTHKGFDKATGTWLPL